METVKQTDESRVAAGKRVRAYLRLVGIEEGESLERLSELVLELAEQSGGGQGIEEAAMEVVLGREEAWLAAFNEEAAKKGYGRADAFAGWRLRRIVEKEPEAFLGEPKVAAEAETMQWRATPEVIEREMPAQELGGLPRALRWSFWRQVWSAFIRPLRYGGG